MTDGTEPTRKAPWHQSTGFLIGAFLMVGPFAIPLVWTNKKLPLAAKLGITVITVVLTLWLIQATARMTTELQAQMKELNAMMNSGATAQ